MASSIYMSTWIVSQGHICDHHACVREYITVDQPYQTNFRRPAANSLAYPRHSRLLAPATRSRSPTIKLGAGGEAETLFKNVSLTALRASR